MVAFEYVKLSPCVLNYLEVRHILIDCFHIINVLVLPWFA